MKKKFTLALLALIGLITLSSALPIANAAAEEAETTNQSEEIFSEHGYLMISPNRFQFGLLEPGNSYSKTFRAYNIGQEAISFNLSVEPFTIKNEAYEQIFSEATNRTKITEWVSFPNGTNHTLAPKGKEGDEVEITIRIRVPSDAVGGGQYAAVMANIVPPESESGNIMAVSRIALPLYTTINGDLNYSGSLVNHRISIFSFEDIVKTNSTIENSGNADFEAVYHLLIEPFLGDGTAFEDTQQKIILPETKRIFEQNWDGAPALGIFNVTQEISYLNSSGEEITDTFKHVAIICPLWLILAILVIITFIVIAIVLRKKTRKINKKKSSWE